LKIPAFCLILIKLFRGIFFDISHVDKMFPLLSHQNFIFLKKLGQNNVQGVQHYRHRGVRLAHEARFHRKEKFFTCPGCFLTSKKFEKKAHLSCETELIKSLNLTSLVGVGEWTERKQGIETFMGSAASKEFEFLSVEMTTADFRSLHASEWIEANVIFLGMHMEMDEIKEKAEILHPSFFPLYDFEFAEGGPEKSAARVGTQFDGKHFFGELFCPRSNFSPQEELHMSRMFHDFH
jgi:hypothetical protein